MNGNDTLKPIFWEGDVFVVLDQKQLPQAEKFIRCKKAEEAIDTIKNMAVRGAPAVGLTGAAAVALGARTLAASNPSKDEFFKKFNHLCEKVKKARPTGYNLEWAVEVMKAVAIENGLDPLWEITEKLRAKAEKLIEEDIEINKAIGKWGRTVIPLGAKMLTYCNAGALATGGYGTALGVIRAAWDQDKTIQVYACETRPYLQGSRLTVYELMKDKIPVTLITDNTAGFLMQLRKIDLVIVGADRIAANGDTANKIGTYSLAVLAKHHNIPFYVAAPRSTIDPQTAKGDKIPIEERSPQELTHIFRKPITVDNAKVLYPAFDVTPNRYISGIITEAGIITKPFSKNIRKTLEK